MSIRESISAERKSLQEKELLPSWFSTDGYALFKEKYAVEGEASFRGRAETIAKCAASYLKNSFEWEQKFFDLIWSGHLSCSTPVLSNMGTNKGLAVSCSGQWIGDSIDEFYGNLRESAILSQNGFGTSGFLGDIRGRGEKISRGGRASGVQPVFEDFVLMSQKVSQGSNRRGAWAGYLPLSHKDYDEVMDFVKKQPDGANLGICIYNSDVTKFNSGDEDLLRRFRKLLKMRMVTGKPYILFPDKVNKLNPQCYIDRGLIVKGSNLCIEIMLFCDLMHSFSCVISAANLAKYNEWKKDTVYNSTVFLDCVAQDLIVKGSKIPGLEKIVRFTEKSRAIGLGVCGFHTYLQQEGIPFESLKASYKNNEIFKHLHDESLRASQWLAKEYGEPEWCKGHGIRNTHRTCCMPTMSTALIMGGISQGIEPFIGNVFVQNSAGGESERINPTFLKVMKKHGKYTKKLAKEIADNNGSVQNLDWLTAEEKLIFRTAFEINQEVIIRLAAQRQKYICQGQSLNLFFSADEDERYISKIHRLAIENDMIKSLYYVRTQSGVSASSGECVACQ